MMKKKMETIGVTGVKMGLDWDNGKNGNYRGYRGYIGVILG